MATNYQYCPSCCSRVHFYRSCNETVLQRRQSKTGYDKRDYAGDFEAQVIRVSDNVDSEKFGSLPNTFTKYRTRKRKINEIMTVASNIVYTITFLDSLCHGLILPLMVPRILSFGGSHTVIGVFTSLQTICQLLSVPLIKSLLKKYGNRNSLQKTLLVHIATFYLLGQADSYWNFILIRCIYCLTNQTSYLCINLLNSITPKEDHFNIIKSLHASGVVGFILGAVIGGYLYELYGFWEICLFSCGFTFVSIVLLKNKSTLQPVQISKDSSEDDLSPSEKTEESSTSKKVKKKLQRNVLQDFIAQLCQDISTTFVDFQWQTYSNHFFLILSQFLFTTSTTVYFTKFPFLLKIHFDATSVIIGYTVAYQRMLLFVMNFAHTTIKSYFNIDRTDSLINVIFVLNMSFVGICFAPSYEIYLICFIPMIAAKMFINDFWKNPFVVAETSKSNICRTLNLMSRITEIIVPTVFGVFCDQFMEIAIYVFILMPLMTLLIVIPFSDKGLKHINKLEKDEVTKKNE